jgi:hypothetical protein
LTSIAGANFITKAAPDSLGLGCDLVTAYAQIGALQDPDAQNYLAARPSKVYLGVIPPSTKLFASEQNDHPFLSVGNNNRLTLNSLEPNMKRQIALLLLTFVVSVGAFFIFTPPAASSSGNRHRRFPGTVRETSSILLPLPTTLDVDRTDDTAIATACTAAPSDCSLCGAIIAANADLSADPVIINLQPATTYNLTLANATQENAAATGDLDITTTLHSVTIIGGGSSGPNASIIDAAALTSGNMRDRVFQITGSGVTAIFQDLVLQPTVKRLRCGRPITSTRPSRSPIWWRAPAIFVIPG